MSPRSTHVLFFPSKQCTSTAPHAEFRPASMKSKTSAKCDATWVKVFGFSWNDHGQMLANTSLFTNIPGSSALVNGCTDSPLGWPWWPHLCWCQAFSTSQLPKVVRTPGAFNILTWKCASRHNGVHFFDISTSKSGPKLVCFTHFDLEMCFVPQRRALFRHLNFQKWSERGVFCTFWLGNVLRATTACTFSTSQLPKVVRGWDVLYILTWKCASRHNGVHFFISRLARWLRTRRFSEPTFRPSGASNHWKNMEKHSVSRLSYLFAHLHLLSSDSFSSLIFSLLLFSSLWLCPALLFICPYCRKFDF